MSVSTVIANWLGDAAKEEAERYRKARERAKAEGRCVCCGPRLGRRDVPFTYDHYGTGA